MSRKISWISVSYYPFFLAATCFALVLYKFFPSTSALLLNFSLLVVCTILFLRILLRYGTRNTSKNSKNERMTLRSSSLKVELIKNDLRAKKLESLRCNPQARSRRTFKGMTIRTAVPGDDDERYSAASKAANENEVNQMDVSSVSSSTLVNEDYFGPSLVNDTDQQSAEGVLDVCQETCAATIGSENVVVSGEDADASRFENRESCLGSPWCHIDHQDAVFDTEVDEAESSDPGAEKAAPMLDELDPHVSMKMSDNLAFSQNQVVCSGDANEKEHKVDEGAQEKNGGSKIPIKLMDLGVSEVERNRRLESLMAKRKARKAKEKNLTNLDDRMETSKTNFQLPSITAPRRNTFDLLYDFDESIPGSAPSTLIPRINIFDLSEEMDDDELLTKKNFVTLPYRDILFRRHESFTIGAPFFSDFNQARRSTRFRFLFDEAMDEPRDTSDADQHRSLGEVSGSKFSFTSESDTDSTISNKGNEGDLAQESHCPFEPKEQNSQSSEDIESMSAEQVKNQMNIGNDHANQVIEEFGTMQDDASEISVSSSLITYADRPELIDDKNVSSYYIPPEAESNSSKTATHEEGSELKQNGGGSFADSTVPNNSIAVDSDALNAEAYQINGSHLEEPSYDSNPTINDTLKSTINEALNNAVSALKKTDGDNLVGGRAESSFMDENESVSRDQISETKKLDISTAQEDLNDPIIPSLAEAAISQNVHHSNSLSTEIESSKSS